MGIEWIKEGQRVAAIIISAEYLPDKTEFITPDDYKQQFGFIVYEKGKTIAPHLHRPVKRNITGTPETLIIKRGKVRVKLYAEGNKILATRELNEGDIILLIEGGHSFEMLEDAIILEIKQGPYMGIEDKEYLA
jgi:cupin fold WbuC family metalloprotein|tara:strand:+ start:219 stop:620 length:402 start_codon:yes stop_codon:yes gene_type:complete